MTDHRTIPGITWESSPGPLRVGDYYRIERFISVVGEWLATHSFCDDCRVIPVITPLAVPEPCDDESDEAEVVLAVTGDGKRLALPDDLGIDGSGWMSERWATLHAHGWRTFAKWESRVGDTDDIGDAVLWVVEGVKP